MVPDLSPGSVHPERDHLPPIRATGPLRPPHPHPTGDGPGRARGAVPGRGPRHQCLRVFGEAGVAALCPHWRITQVRPVRDIVTYDLTTPGALLAIGALPALAAGNEHRGLTQQWARAIYEDQPSATKVDGIHYRTAYNDDHALALWDCDNAITVAHDRTGQLLDLPLTHPRIHPRLLAALIPRHITITPTDETHCPNCQRAAAP
ncbi:RES domain-containing protein [Rhodococcus opacus]|uniref:RES domain-containing protein n=1 Tax=Rhodococcus opacus TaxID=37919 RepID=UPI001F4420A3|nr:RES domain-containing protein [Rhodococcus opacus]